MNVFILNAFGVRFVLQRDFGGELRLEANGGLEKMLLGDPGELGGGAVAEYIYKKKNLTMTMGTKQV